MRRGDGDFEQFQAVMITVVEGSNALLVSDDSQILDQGVTNDFAARLAVRLIHVKNKTLSRKEFGLLTTVVRNSRKTAQSAVLDCLILLFILLAGAPFPKITALYKNEP